MPYPHTGKAVHYVAEPDEAYDTQCRAAIVTQVLPPTGLIPPGTYVNLLVMDDSTESHVSEVGYNEATDPYIPGTWHEPEVVVA